MVGTLLCDVCGLWMVWRGAETPGEYPTLGFTAVEWIEEYCVVPDGPHAGEPMRLTDEQYRLLLQHYRLRPDAEVSASPSAAFAYRRSMLVRPQKWGKSPLAAAMICFEAAGPALFAGWDAAGEPVGRPWATPWVQVAAASEDQTANVWRALLPMMEEGPLADVIPDTGLSRINLPAGGYIEPVTAQGRSRLGQRITFAVHDEPHSWLKSNGGWTLADTQRRNLAGMGGRAFATTNAWNPAENSDAQRTAEANSPDVYIDYPTVPPGSLKNKRARVKVLKAAYGDSALEAGGWVDLARIGAEVDELVAVGDLAQAERFYANRVVATSDAYFDAEAWAARAAPVDVPDGALVCLGFDGSQYDDWTAIRGRWIDDDRMYGFTPTFADGAPTVWNPADYGGEVPRGEVRAAVAELFDRYTVVRFYLDPELWRSEIDEWATRYGPKRVVQWETFRTRQMAAALERLRTDIGTSAMTHDGDATVLAHFRNARRVRRPGGIVIGKPADHQKIDLVMADALSHEAAADARAAGQAKRRERRVLVL